MVYEPWEEDEGELAGAPSAYHLPQHTAADPAFHEPGHSQAGHQEYSFKLTFGMGLTDGEGCERIWAANNALGNATKTQGPGSRQDVIDDHLGFWNWLKYSGMGRYLPVNIGLR